jgi:hypothetical protein
VVRSRVHVGQGPQRAGAEVERSDVGVHPQHAALEAVLRG